MKIVHVFNELKFSGAEKMYVEAAKLFQDKGCELIAVATGNQIGEYSTFFKDAGFTLFHLPIPNLKEHPVQFIKYVISFSKFLKKEKVSLLHIHVNQKFWWYALSSKIAGIRSIRTVHNIFINSKKIYWLKYWFERWSSKLCFGLVFQSIGDSVEKNELRYCNKTTKIYNWYSPSFLPGTLSEKTEIREKLSILEGKFVIISVGGCSNIKSHTEIIKCLPVLSNNIDILYLHLGSGSTECEEIDLATNLGVINKIRFEGNKDNIRDYLIASDVYVMSSKFEGLSIASIEALAVGVPAIVYNNPGVKDVIVNGYNGFLIEPEYHLLSQKIELLFMNPTMRIEMGTAATSYCEENFSMKKNAERIFKLYTTCI